jgi:hypothetical protein
MQGTKFSTVTIAVAGVVFIITGILVNSSTVWTIGAIGFALMAILASTATRR